MTAQNRNPRRDGRRVVTTPNAARRTAAEFTGSAGHPSSYATR